MVLNVLYVIWLHGKCTILNFHIHCPILATFPAHHSLPHFTIITTLNDLHKLPSSSICIILNYPFILQALLLSSNIFLWASSSKACHVCSILHDLFPAACGNPYK